MEPTRGWNSRYARENTGRIRLCKARFYWDIEGSSPGIRDAKGGGHVASLQPWFTREKRMRRNRNTDTHTSWRVHRCRDLPSAST